jgi:hypothetical protein
LRTGTKISEQPLIKKLGMPSSPTDLDGLRRLRALQMSSSEIGANDRHSEDCEGEGKTPVQGETSVITIIIIIIIK